MFSWKRLECTCTTSKERGGAATASVFIFLIYKSKKLIFIAQKKRNLKLFLQIVTTNSRSKRGICTIRMVIMKKLFWRRVVYKAAVSRPISGRVWPVPYSGESGQAVHEQPGGQEVRRHEFLLLQDFHQVSITWLRKPNILQDCLSCYGEGWHWTIFILYQNLSLRILIIVIPTLNHQPWWFHIDFVQ